MTGLNEFKKWIAMERESLKCTLPFGLVTTTMTWFVTKKLDLTNLTASKKNLKGA